MHNIDRKYFLLDSCIVEYLLEKELNSPLSKQLQNWSDNIFELSISEITYAELIDGSITSKEKRVLDLLDKFYSFSIN